MSDWLREIGPAVGNHLWQSTAFAGVVWLATLLLRRSPARVRHGLWMAASLKFLVPFALLIGLGGLLPRPRHAVVAMPVYSAVDEVGLPFDEGAVPVRAAAEAHISESRFGAPSWPMILAAVWLCGVLVVLWVWAVRWRRIAKTLRLTERLEDGREAGLLLRVEESMGTRQRISLLLSRELMEPGIFGVFRPVLIWPERLSERLDDEHIEAIMIHEVAHARRRDNLTAALHMLVEATFWFHPMLWWMERRMIEEREQACDEAVVQMGSMPGVYAESLLKACRFCVESPLVCVSGITGADLNRRVRSIMTLRLKRLGLAGKIALAAVALVAIAGPVAFGVVRMIPMYGEVLKATGPLPSYEVVVIKPSQEGAHGASSEGEETHYLMTAKMLIQFAYGIFNPPKVMDLNVVGGPDWINTDVFSIVGKMESTEFEQEQKLGRSARHERRQLMEQSLLADRFKLKMHVETRDEPVYALTVTKGGPKMTPAKDVTGGAHVNPNPGSMAAEELKRGLIVQAKGRNFVMTVKGMTLDTFVDALVTQKETAGRQVVNQTGLTGAYDFTLTWGPEDTPASDGGDLTEATEPPLFTAIQQQLGLKLADGKGPAEVVVIDHIEKPVFDSAEVPGKVPVVATALAVGQRLLGSLMPAAFVQEKAAPSDGSVRAKPFQFDVVSIRPAAPSVPGRKRLIGFQFTDDGLVATNDTLERMLMFQYQPELQNDSNRILGGPDWARTLVWDVRAKVADSDIPEWSKLSHDSSVAAKERRRATVQAMFAERFKLKTHIETREGTIYALVVAKDGLKIKHSDSDAPPQMEMRGMGHVTIHRAEIGALAPMFARELGHPVVDQTGLSGKYDLTLDWASSQGAPGGDAAPASDSAPSLFTAVQEQLGLKLEAQKGPIEYLVIDSAEKPSVDGAEVPAAASALAKVSPMQVAMVQEKASSSAPDSPSPIESYSVISVKPSAAGMNQRGQAHIGDTGVEARNMPLKYFIKAAYGVQNAQIAGGPPWLDSQLFDVVAKSDQAVAAEGKDWTPAQRRSFELRGMLPLQNLLADRFGLKVHFEDRETAVYALVVAKGGPKLQAAGTIKDIYGSTSAGIRGLGPGQLAAMQSTTDQLARFLDAFSSKELGRPVVDKTGLTTTYDFRLQWTPDPVGASDEAGSAGASLFTALQDQLGLRLEAQKAPVRTLVIDHVQMPSPD